MLSFFLEESECLSTAGFMKTVPSVYTPLMNTIACIYLSHSTQVAEEPVFKKHMVVLLTDIYVPPISQFSTEIQYSLTQYFGTELRFGL